MTPEQLEQAVADYKVSDKMQSDLIGNYKNLIARYEQLINNVRNHSVYGDVYREEYGDYRQFLQDLARRLRDEIL
jgi:site-specific DNA-adenine methylase